MSPFWYCNVCEAQNHEIDGTCQYCECLGAECKRDNCDGPGHPGLDDAYYDDGCDKPCPSGSGHRWPDDIREEGGGHVCLNDGCNADGLS